MVSSETLAGLEGAFSVDGSHRCVEPGSGVGRGGAWNYSYSRLVNGFVDGAGRVHLKWWEENRVIPLKCIATRPS